MDLKSYYDGLPRGQKFKLAQELGMPAGYLCQMATGYVKVPPGRALAIEEATKGQVTRRELLPEDWHKYWLPSELEHTASTRKEVEQ
ncbi:TPA: helix-turn-helix domain-containing protein [Enterobacter cloacae]|nr:helix-turn-helix domain-containing protein [Enterobacter cloacae]